MLRSVLFCWCFLVSLVVIAQPAIGNIVLEHYTKTETYITMRDGVRLFTVIYSPKDKSEKHPILIKRTPYSCKPYGEETFPDKIGPSPYIMQEKYIIVYQDVRGRWMSEGTWTNMTPHIPKKKKKTDVDESSDTYDTIDWLIKNIDNNNGRVGLWGVSYPGFYATAGSIDAHPALKASSPQACIGDFFFDDFHHNGAYLLSYWRVTGVFGYPNKKPTKEAWYTLPDLGTPDDYQFFLDKGPLKNLTEYQTDNFFWEELRTHPNYDEFWQKRGIIQHLDDVKPAMMVVGGWFDAEDLYGPLETYKTIEKENPKTYNTIVMGPWSHGDWARDKPRNSIGNVYFGDSISDYYQREIELTFFNHFLKKKKGKPDLPEAYMFDSGLKEWRKFAQWPPENITRKDFYFGERQSLGTDKPTEDGFSDFVSDPAKPVPSTEDIKITFTPRKYMTDDQRFAARRPDVLVFESEVLTEDMTLAGEIMAKLFVATTGSDADWIVKLIDVFPPDHENYPETQDHLQMGNYHMMVRSEVMRGRFRENMSQPIPFTPNEVTPVHFQLQDVCHTFKKGHKIQFQVQSTWFPLIDRNPQTFVDNIFEANEEDFQKQTHQVHHSAIYPSSVEVSVLKTDDL